MATPTPAPCFSFFQGGSIDLNNVSPRVLEHVDNVIIKFADSVLKKRNMWDFGQFPLSEPVTYPLIINSNRSSSSDDRGDRCFSVIIASALLFVASYMSGRFYCNYEKYALLFEEQEEFRKTVAEQLKSSWNSSGKMNATDRGLSQAVLDRVAPLNHLNILTSELMEKKYQDAFVDVALSVAILSATCFVAMGFVLSVSFLQCAGLILGCPPAIYALVRYGYNSHSDFEQARATQIRDMATDVKRLIRAEPSRE